MPSSAHYTLGMQQILYTPHSPQDQPEPESKVLSPFLYLGKLRSENVQEAGRSNFF